MTDDTGEMLLGKNVPVADQYSPSLLYPIPREVARETLGLSNAVPFFGVDLWHAYEVSWLNEAGKPEVRVARFFVPADSPCMVESKSFKLYLNSINGTAYASEQQVHETITADLSRVVGSDVELELFPVDAPELDGGVPEGDCLDALDISIDDSPPGIELLRAGEEVVEESLYSHLLRSLCPVTGQPDWATVYLYYRGRKIDRKSLLRYLIAFRNHQEFHEQCVERMFVDLQRLLEPEFLEVQAFYTRRGGLDINPFRSTDPTGVPLSRMNRQ